MINNWFKIFIFQIRQNKLFTLLNILGLSIGISGLIFAILYWNDEAAYNRHNPDKEFTYQVINNMGDGDFWDTNVSPLEPHLKTMSEISEYCYLYQWYNNDIVEADGVNMSLTQIINTQKNIFSFFPFEFIHGSPKTALEDMQSIAISENTSLTFFGATNSIGKTIKYGNVIYTVKAVFKIPHKSSIMPNALISTVDRSMENERQQGHWGNYSFGLFLKIKNPENISRVSDKIFDLYFENITKKWAKEEGISPEEYNKKNPTPIPLLEPIENVRLYGNSSGLAEGRGNLQLLRIMMGISILILLLSIMNYINLATANALKRAKEVGIRKTFGATKNNIILQFLFETIILTFISILIALVIVELSLPYYNNFLNKILIINGSEFYIQIIMVFLIVVFLAGIFPAVYISNLDVSKVIKGNFYSNSSGVWFRNTILIIQFSIAALFIISSNIFNRQIEFLINKNIGFKGDQIAEINYVTNSNDPTQVYNRYLTVKQELLKIKGIKEVSNGTFSFGKRSSSISGFEHNGTMILGNNMSIDYGMLEMMNIKILEGRNISPHIATDTVNAVLVNKTALRQMKEKEIIGKEINWNDRKLKVIGVVDDFNIFGPHVEIPPMVFFHYKTIEWMPRNMRQIYVKIDPDNMQETIADIEKFWVEKVDAKYPFSYEFVEKQFARSYENFINQKNLFTLLNFTVILIALFGLFSLASFSIQRRMKEIAIRKALGAETKTLLKELSKQYIVFCSIGFIIAIIPAYFLLEKWLQNFAYRIDISIIPFITGFFALLILTLIIVLSKAYQATKVDVLKYLKYE